MSIIGQQLEQIRKSKKISYRDLSKLTNLSHTNLSRFEKGYDSKGNVKGSIQIDDLKTICEGLNYPFRQFLEEAGYIEPVSPETLIERPSAEITDIKAKTFLEMYNALPNVELQMKIITTLAVMLEGAGIDSQQYLTKINF